MQKDDGGRTRRTTILAVITLVLRSSTRSPIFGVPADIAHKIQVVPRKSLPELERYTSELTFRYLL